MNNSNDLIGRMLGTCRIEQIIGQGGMGIVYLAQQIRPMRRVAVKLLLPEASVRTEVSKEFLIRFQREADVIAQLEHVNIMPIYEYDELDNLAYLVMPYLTGGSLRDILARKGALSLVETVVYIEQAAAALDYAHEHGVIHRDLKPGNFLLHSDGRLVLADFGIARIIQDSDSTLRATLTGTGMFLGTPDYMAPEMVSGEPIDHRADIYALGIILFQMLSGQVPFRGNTPYAVAHKHVQEQPPPLHSLNPAVPAVVDSIIQKALAKRPENRYPSAGTLAQALRSAVAIPGNLSETELRNAPTVISPIQSATPVETLRRYETPPPVHQPVNATTGSSAPTYLRQEPTSGSSSQSGFTQPVSPHPASTNRLQPWLIFIGILLVMVLVVGGVLIGLQLNKGTTTSTGLLTTPNAPHTSNTAGSTQITATSHPSSGSTPNSQPTSAPTVTQQTGEVPKGATLYSVSTPGKGCDTAGKWFNDGVATTCLIGIGVQISNTQQSALFGGAFLSSIPSNSSFPNDYIVEVQLQQSSTSRADFGIYFRSQPGTNQGTYTFIVHSDGTWSAYVYDNA